MQSSANLPPNLSAAAAVKTKDIVCPIGLEIMFNPVTTSCGHAFEEENLEKHLANDRSCPVCKGEILHYSKTSIFIKDAIEERIDAHPELLRQQYLSEKIVVSCVENGFDDRKNFIALVKFNNLDIVMSKALILRARKRCETKPKEALADCAKARELDPTNDTIYVVESLIYIFDKNYPAATLACKLAIDGNHYNGEAYSVRALLNFKLQKQKDEIIKDLNTALSLNVIPKLLDEILQSNSYELQHCFLAQLQVASGMWAYQRGEFHNAIKLYDNAIELSPNLAAAYIMRAYAYCKIFSLDKAIADIDHVIGLDSDLIYAYIVKGYIYDQKKEWYECLKYLDFACSKSPSFPNLLFMRAQCLLKMHELKAAIAGYDAALKLNPENINIRISRIEAFIQDENFSKALEDANTILANSPENSYVLIKRAYVHLGLDDFSSAMIDIGRVSAIYPKAFEVLRARASAYLYNTENDKALEDVEEALKLCPQDAKCLAMRAEVLWNLERYQDAIDHINTIEILDDFLLTIRGGCHYYLKNYSAASKDLNAVVRMESDFNAVYYRSLVNLECGDYEKSLADIDRALSLDPEFIEALSVRAKIHVRNKNYKLAIADYEQILRIDADETPALMALALAYYHQGDFLRAVELHTQLIEMFPEDPDFVMRRSACYLAINNKVSALEDYNTVLRMAPDHPALIELKARMDAKDEKDEDEVSVPPSPSRLANAREGIFKRSHEAISGLSEERNDKDSDSESSKTPRPSPSY